MMKKSFIASLFLNIVLVAFAAILFLRRAPSLPGDPPDTAVTIAYDDARQPPDAREQPEGASAEEELEITLAEARLSAKDRRTLRLGIALQKEIGNELGLDRQRSYWEPIRHNDRRLTVHSLMEILDDLLALHALEHLDVDSYPLPPEKVRAAARVEHEYDTMQRRIHREARGIYLPEDQETVKLLAEKMRRDMEAIFSPDELLEYRMRKSTAFQNKLRSVDVTEEEFRTMYRLQYGTRSDDEASLSVAEARAKKEEDQRALLGEERYRQYKREGRHEYTQITAIAERLQLPRENANQAYELREAAESSRREIETSGLPLEERRAALRTLSTDSREELLRLLGEDGFELFQQNAGLHWLDQ